MESLGLIKKRIKSIETTRQITKSMRLVATVRVQKARANLDASTPFLTETERLVRISVANLLDDRHPFIKPREVKKTGIIVVSGDRGLCGGYNVNVNRYLATLVKSLNSQVKLISIGLKARDFCRRRYKDLLEHSFTDISDNPSYDEATVIVSIAQEWFNNGEIDRLYVVYTEFVSMLVHMPTKKQLLPLDMEAINKVSDSKKQVRCEPEDGRLLTNAATFYIASCLYGALLEASASEQSSRVTRMDSAVKNADDMIEGLTLQYNQVRQGAITQEIIEIVGGANAV